MQQPLALVTGASRGIGAACAKALAQQGLGVIVNFVRDEAAAHAVVRAIASAGGKAWAVQADVSEEAGVLQLFEAVDQRGDLRVLVNNAGVVDIAAPVAQMSAARIERMFKTNVFSAFLCAREAVRRMSLNAPSGGNIINLSSAASRLGSPNQYVDYAASKGAIDTFTIGLAKEVAALGIRVNAVRAGIIDTDIHASGGQPDRARELAHQIPMQRPGTADEVAQTVAWLASDASSYTTGALIDVSGGR